MLSFLRDQSLEDLPAQQKTNKNTGKSPGDGAGKSQEPEYLTVATQGKRVRKSTTLLAVLFIIGLLCLWFMIKKSTPKTASAEAGKNDKMDEIVSKFYEFSNVPQVKVNELAKNPFELEAFSANLKHKPDSTEKAQVIDAEMLWRRQMRQKSQGMQLLSIMQSNQAA